MVQKWANKFQENYKNGLRHGKFTGWYEKNGNISSEKYFNNNEREENGPPGMRMVKKLNSSIKKIKLMV